MTTDDEVLSLLIHGHSKVGKSSLSFTGPFPMCSLDAEGSTKFIRTDGFRGSKPIRKIKWNPMEEDPPQYNGDWDVAVVNVPDWITVKTAKERLAIQEHAFAHVSLDSITELQRKCKANMGRAHAMQQQDWGALLHEMDLLIRGFRDLLLLPNTLKVATFIAETEDQKTKGKWRPSLQGAIAGSLPYWVDICGFATLSVDESGAKGMDLLVSSHPNYEAGERVQGVLPDVI